MRNQSRRLAILLFAGILLLVAVLPAAAQFDNGDIGRGQCLHIEINTGPTGEYIHIFLYQEEFNELLNGTYFPPLDIQTTAPNTILVYNVMVTPQTLLAVATPYGLFEAYVFEDGEHFEFGGGAVSWHPAPMDTVCLGAATDGRLNRFDLQMLAAIYPDGHDGYDVWKVDAATSAGSFDYNVSRAQVDAALQAARSSGQSRVVATGATSVFYATPDNACVLTSPNANGDTQTFDFACAPSQ